MFAFPGKSFLISYSSFIRKSETQLRYFLLEGVSEKKNIKRFLFIFSFFLFIFLFTFLN
jgi:hypothetical protein